MHHKDVLLMGNPLNIFFMYIPIHLSKYNRFNQLLSSNSQLVSCSIRSIVVVLLSFFNSGLKLWLKAQQK